jgi:hypothetical protein
VVFSVWSMGREREREVGECERRGGGRGPMRMRGCLRVCGVPSRHAARARTGATSDMPDAVCALDVERAARLRAGDVSCPDMPCAVDGRRMRLVG